MNKVKMTPPQIRQALYQKKTVEFEAFGEWHEIQKVGLPIFAIGAEYVTLDGLGFPLVIPVTYELPVRVSE